MAQIPLAPNRNRDATQDSSVRQQRIPEGYREALTQGALRQNESRNTFRSTQQLRYPKETGLLAEQPHWLKILIRVREQNSQATGGNVVGGTYTETSARRVSGENATAIAATVGAASGASRPTGGLTGKIPILNFATKAVKGLTGAAAGALATAASGSNKSTTLSTSICLGLQEPPKADYSVEWEEQALGSVLSGGSQGLFNTAKGLAGETLRRQINPGKIGEIAGVDQAAATAAVDKSLGKIRNPYREQIFKQVNFREFTFEYTFLPESVQEAEQVLAILKVLRQNMLPEVAQNSFYMIYPAEFSLYYMYKENINPHVHQFSDCVLTSMSVKYGGQDFVTFKGTPGLPAEVTMTLKFKEIVPITGDRVYGENL